MESKRSCFLIWVLFFLCASRLVEAMINNSYDSDSLDEYVQQYSYKNLTRPKTGILYNISLPSNFTGMEVSFIRFRTRNFWLRGFNFSSLHVPPRILPIPFVRRFNMVYQNLGNWSSYYYNVPNYTLISPVIGLMIYNATNSSTRGNSTVNFCVKTDPILVRFPRIFLSENQKNVTMQCVRFGKNGLVELSNMTMPNVCIARGQGHFSIVMPTPPPLVKKKERFWKWWVIGFGVGIVGLVLVALIGVVIYKFVKRKRIGQMERQSERSEALVTTWVGMSKMPSATRIRTQPVIESDYVP